MKAPKRKHDETRGKSLGKRTDPVFVILPRLDPLAGTGKLVHDLTGANREAFARSLVESLYKLYPDLRIVVDRILAAVPDSAWPPLIGLDIPKWAVTEVELQLRNGDKSAESAGGAIG